MVPVRRTSHNSSQLALRGNTLAINIGKLVSLYLIIPQFHPYIVCFMVMQMADVVLSWNFQPILLCWFQDINSKNG
jgi:hypothetical protein